MTQEQVRVFNIQHYSLHDGPGIRTTVFLKGCPLCCRWCCNPESQSYEDAGDGFGAGRLMTIHEIMEEVEQDRVFYRHGGGGLTVSGGEPLSHGTFTVNLLREARERYLSTAIETSGAVETEVLLDAANYLDCIYYDVKSVNASRHELWTGCSNEKILRNLEALLEYCRGMDDPPEVIVRTPVIPGFNDTRQDILAICDYLQSIGQTRHELLRYHRYGQSKYEKLGRQYLMGDAVLDDAAWQELTMLHSQLF